MKKLLLLILLLIIPACMLARQTGPVTSVIPPTVTTAATNVPMSAPTDATTATGGGTRKNKSSATSAPGPSTAAVRRPVGIYAHVDLLNFIKNQKKTNHSITAAQLDTQLNGLYQGLLANPAIAGLTVGAHWDLINPNSPSSPQPYDWSYLDDAFNQVSMWNTKNPTQTPKTIQLIVEAGFDTPAWVLDQLP